MQRPGVTFSSSATLSRPKGTKTAAAATAAAAALPHCSESGKEVRRRVVLLRLEVRLELWQNNEIWYKETAVEVLPGVHFVVNIFG